MAAFTIRLDVPRPAPQVWAAVLDLRAHADIIPATTVIPSLVAAELQPGTQFLARTAVGPVGVDDPMRVDSITPATDTTAGTARISKEGKAARGDILLTVTPVDSGSCRVEWAQDLVVRGVPRALDPLVAVTARAAYRLLLRRLVARA
jgi:carbon monoxide dehydrogenase subunit G